MQGTARAHEKPEPIVLEYGKAKLSIPMTAKTRVWAWVLMLGLTGASFAHQLMLRNEIASCRRFQDYLLEQLTKSRVPQSKAALPWWGNSDPSQMTPQTPDRSRLISPLRQLLEDSASR